MKEKVLTKSLVYELGLDKVSVITADMLDGYTSIGDDAFYRCSSLTSVTIPDSVMSIGDFAFDGCENLTHVKIPNSVTSIGNSAFEGCKSLTSVMIPNSVTKIGYGAFYGCGSLKSVHTSDIAAWCAISFESQLANPLYYAHNLYLNGKLITDLVIPNSVTSIGNYAFENCTGLTSATILDGVTSIGYEAFEGCSRLTSVTIPNSVTSIGDDAFYYCTGLTSVTIPNSVTSIGSSAFDGCTGLTSVTIKDKTYEKQVIKDGKCKAYKAFNADMTCRRFQYKEDKTYELDGESMLCHYGFHACLNLADVFNYYYGNLGEDIVVHEVELEGVSNERDKYDSKVVTKKITIGKRIL